MKPPERSSKRVTAGPLRRRNVAARGLALIVVLWATAIITLLATSFSMSLRTEAKLAASAVERAQGAAAAEAGIYWLMREVLKADDSPLAADSKLTFHDFEVELQALPENAKIDLNAAPEPLLKSMIEYVAGELALESVSAGALTDAILDWRDADENARPFGAEARDYTSAGRDLGPRNGPFMSVNELNQVLGMDPKLYRALEPMVTVHAWSSKISPMSASEAVLRSIPGITAAQVDAFVLARGDLENEQQAINLLRSGSRYLARSQSTVYSLVARARSASGVQSVRRAVVKMNGKRGQPMSILAWYENASSEDKVTQSAVDDNAAESGQTTEK